MRLLIIVLLASLFQVGFAQQYDPEKISKKNKALYTKALEYADQDLYQDALGLINLALENDPGYLDAQLSKAGILGELKRYPEAVKCLQQGFCDGFCLHKGIPASIQHQPGGNGKVSGGFACNRPFFGHPQTE